ncbi:amidohydrolase [Thozetella sp. PMI_491]|nr:amidohydrolase [Thozetella sp. PMI_491]
MTQRLVVEQPAAQAVQQQAVHSSSSSSSATQVQALAPPVFSTAFGISFRPKASIGADDASAAKKVFYTIIKAGLLIPGDGEPIENAALVVEDKLIAWVGPQADIPAEYTTRNHRGFSVPYLMPGLWDVHVHCGGVSPDTDVPGYVGFITTHPASAGARLTRGLWESLQRGYTSIRDVAGYGCELSQAIDDGSIVGPNIYSSGACLSQLAGHGDVFQLPVGDVLSTLGVSKPHPGHYSTGMTTLVDGVDECRRAVRMQIRRGAKVIKILASGGVMSRDDDPLNAQFSPEELDVIVSEAKRQRRGVAAHVHGKDGILAAVNAGVTTVEHVSFADQECIDLIKENDVIYVATRQVVQMLLDTGGVGLPKQIWEKAQLCGAMHLTAYKLAIAAGITFAMGTDTPPGENQAVELDYAVQAGLSSLEAIKAATANGPLAVGPQAAKSGQLKAGYEADLIAVTENPVADVKVLQDKEKIKWVWKGGKLYKGPGVGPWGEL